MRHALRVDTPSLFPPEMVESEESSDVLVESAERPSALRARDFVGWCWSFGSDFHNSPDITNLRYWMRKFQCSVSSEEEEGEILVEARRLFLKKVGQAVRKADVPKDKD